MRRCDNCHAEIPEGKGGRASDGRFICCPHCVFNPLGCRCKWGEFEVGETQQPFVGDDEDLDDYDDYDAEDYEQDEWEGESFDCGMIRDAKTGQLLGCGKAGSEECEFECPHRAAFLEEMRRSDAARRGWETRRKKLKETR